MGSVGLEVIKQSLSSLSDDAVRSLAQTNKELEEWGIKILLDRKRLDRNIYEEEPEKRKIVAFFDLTNPDPWLKIIIKKDWIDILDFYKNYITEKCIDYAIDFDAINCFKYLSSIGYNVTNAKYFQKISIGDKVELFKFLVSKGIKFYPEDYRSYPNILKYLVEVGLYKNVRILIQEKRFDLVEILLQQGYNGFNSHHINHFIYNNQFDIVKTLAERNLIKEPFDIDYLLKKGWFNIVKILLDNGLNLTNNQLIAYINNLRLDQLPNFLDKNLKDKYIETNIVKKFGQEGVDLLMKKGYDINNYTLQNLMWDKNYEDSVIYILDKYGKKFTKKDLVDIINLATSLDQTKVLKYLRDKKFNPDLDDFIKAIDNGHKEIVEILLCYFMKKLDWFWSKNIIERLEEKGWNDLVNKANRC